MDGVMQINEDFRFRRVDEHSWAFEARKVAKKSGKERWVAKAYSVNLPQTLRLGAAWLVENEYILPPAMRLLEGSGLKDTVKHREAYRNAVAKALEAIADNLEAEEEA